MAEVLTNYLTEIMAGVLSLVAVGVSLYRAQAVETEAEAAAISELASSSSDLRERVRILEEINQRKEEELAVLRQQAAQIPVMEAQIKFLTRTLTRVREEANELRDEFTQSLNAKQEEIDRLKSGGSDDDIR